MDSESHDATFQPDSRDAESSQESLLDECDKTGGTIVVSDFLKLDFAGVGGNFVTNESNQSESLKRPLNGTRRVAKKIKHNQQ